MAIITIEVVGSREANMSIESPSVELMFTLYGSEDDSIIRAAIEAEIPATWTVTSAFFGTMVLVLQSYRVRQRADGGPTFDGTATYGRTQPRKTGQLWFSFDGTGGTAHIQTSLQTVNRYGRNDVQGPPTGVAATTQAGGSLTNSTIYRYKVTAHGTAGETTGSSETSILTASPNLSANITWNAVSGATAYSVYRVEGLLATFVTPCLLGLTTSLAFTDNGAAAAAGAPPTSFTPQEIPDYKQAIGVSGDSVEGCDKIIPMFKFRLDYYPATALMTPAYILALYNLQARPVNADVVNMGGITFDAGTLLYLGPTGQPRGFDDWELGLNFIASPNVQGIRIGDIINIDKRGHDYLWCRYMDAVDRSVGIKVPQFAFVERIYDSGDFTTLGLTGIPVQGLANP